GGCGALHREADGGAPEAGANACRSGSVSARRHGTVSGITVTHRDTAGRSSRADTGRDQEDGNKTSRDAGSEDGRQESHEESEDEDLEEKVRCAAKEEPMNVRHVTSAVLLACVACVGSARAQESPIGADFKNEGKDTHTSCVEDKSIVGCAATFVTDHPLHIAFGTIAPQNGVGVGPALVWHWTPSSNWRWNGSADAVFPGAGAWRVGAYATIVRTKVDIPRLVVGGGGGPRRVPRVHPYPIIKLYSQSISLPQLLYFGVGPDTTLSDKSFFGERESVTG